MKKCSNILRAATYLLFGGGALLESSCFTTMNHLDLSESHSPPSTKADAVLATADVVTLPIQVPFILAYEAKNHIEEQYQANRDAALTAIKKDPLVVQGWNLETQSDTPEKAAIALALESKDQVFSDDLLREIVKRSPQLRDDVFSSPGTSEAFIRAAFVEELHNDALGQPAGIRGMILNPNTPDDLLLEIVKQSSKNNQYIFPAYGPVGRIASTVIIRAAFEDELQKNLQSQPSAILLMLANPNFPEDLKFQILQRAPSNLPFLFEHNPSESLIRAGFEVIMLAAAQGQYRPLGDILRSTHMPDDLKIEIMQRSPKVDHLISYSEALIRKVFEDELHKGIEGQPNAIGSMIDSGNMPSDLLIRVSESTLPDLVDATRARNELTRRARNTAR